MTRTSPTFAEATSVGAHEFLPSAEPMTRWGDVFRHAPALDAEAWHDTLRSTWGRYQPAASDPKAFIAKVRAQSLFGFPAMHLMPSAIRVERTQRDARLDGMDHYYALFSVAGTVTVIQNGHAVELTDGQALLLDSARSVTFVDGRDQQPNMFAADTAPNNYRQCFVLQLPRQSLVSHLGFEPQHGPGVRWDTSAGRVLFSLVRDGVDDDTPMSASGTGYMQLAIYDLIGAIFSPSDPAAFSRSDKLFKRVCDIVTDHFADPDVGPDDVATEAGISRRYLQKLFAVRNLTYTEFINSVRLDHAARLLQRRARLNTTQPISAIAYASGFGDYANFARQFQKRFGHSPGVHIKRNRPPQ